jgi:hypothetical protein
MTSRLSLILLLSAVAFAQQRTPAGQMIRPSLPKSPEILPDGKVTFRLTAPEANKVLGGVYSDAAKDTGK